jgi:hypothetical protein
MTAVKLATCHVPTNPASPAPVAGYVVACSTFYEREFGAPPLIATVLWLGTASSESFGDPTYPSLRNLVRSLHGD